MAAMLGCCGVCTEERGRVNQREGAGGGEPRVPTVARGFYRPAGATASISADGARRWIGRPPQCHRAASWRAVEDNRDFIENPLALGDFWETLRWRCFARFGDSNGVQKL
jgi:hypothetical protein